MNDDESGLHKDIWKWLEHLAPFRADYEHHRTGEDNGDAHLKSLLVHHEVTVPIIEWGVGSTSGRGSASSMRSSMASATSGHRQKAIGILMRSRASVGLALAALAAGLYGKRGGDRAGASSRSARRAIAGRDRAPKRASSARDGRGGRSGSDPCGDRFSSSCRRGEWAIVRGRFEKLRASAMKALVAGDDDAVVQGGRVTDLSFCGAGAGALAKAKAKIAARFAAPTG